MNDDELREHLGLPVPIPGDILSDTSNDIRKHSGNKYLRTIRTALPDNPTHITVDVYCVLECYEVTCPAVAHAVKKLLCAGLRDKGDRLKDLREARDAITRAIQLEEYRK